jgi:hypothetical protein
VFANLLPSFSNELLKIAADVSAKVDKHFDSPKKDWKRFEKNLRVGSFQKAVSDDPRADEKLRAYAKNFGDFKRSREVVTTVPSRSGKGKHTIKKLESGRLGCSCKDWQFKHSHQGTDCDHILGMKKTKTSAPNFFAQGANLAVQHERVKGMQGKAKKMKAMTGQLRQYYGVE